MEKSKILYIFDFVFTIFAFVIVFKPLKIDTFWFLLKKKRKSQITACFCEKLRCQFKLFAKKTKLLKYLLIFSGFLCVLRIEIVLIYFLKCAWYIFENFKHGLWEGRFINKLDIFTKFSVLKNIFIEDMKVCGYGFSDTFS